MIGIAEADASGAKFRELLRELDAFIDERIQEAYTEDGQCGIGAGRS